MKYTEIIQQNKILSEKLKDHNNYNITILSNITVNQIKEILEYNLRINNINAYVDFGDYDNIVQDSSKFKDSDLIIIFWELANIIDGLQYKSELFSEKEISALIDKTINEIDFVLNNLKNSPAIFFNTFSALAFNNQVLKKNNFDRICSELNNYLENLKLKNLYLINIDKIIAQKSIINSIDFRYYYSSKALYTIDFYKSYSELMLPIVLSITGKAKKALIFDCDNTLWKGIIGEDGINNIKLTSKHHGGTPYEEVQSLAKMLINQGIIVGLCSKNNKQDVDDVFLNHKGMVLKENDFIIKKVNWKDKVTNLIEIAEELNIGLDSLVFVDDSDFEINYVKEQLPQIYCMQVPGKVSSYPAEFRKILSLFYNATSTNEDLKRSSMYKEQVKRIEEKKEFSNLEDYLKALEIKVEIFINDFSIIPRMSQMTQKTNQFNLTTKRYTETEIRNFIEDDIFFLTAISVKDKYGDNGITGLAIINIIDDTAELDTFLLSCRIIGRNIEFVLFDAIYDLLNKKGVKNLKAYYFKTEKNNQVENFYEKTGLTLIDYKNDSKKYIGQLQNINKFNIDYIETKHGKKD